MAKPPKTRDGDNGGADKETILRHMAIAFRDQAEVDEVKARQKVNLKRANSAGVDVKEMKATMKMSSWSALEIARKFAKSFQYLGAIGQDVGTQFDLFGGPIPAKKKEVDFYPAGLFDGLQDKPCSPSPSFTDTQRNRWIEGWHEGQKRYEEGNQLAFLVGQNQSGGAAPTAAALDGQSDLEEVIASNAVEGTGGATLDGGVKKFAAQKRLDLVLADFNVESFDDITQETYSGSPTDFEEYDLIVVTGAGDQRKVLKDVLVEAPFEEASAEELAQQKGRPVAEEPEAAAAPVEAAKPKGKAKAPAKPKESQSEKAARLAAEAGV